MMLEAVTMWTRYCTLIGRKCFMVAALHIIFVWCIGSLCMWTSL